MKESIKKKLPVLIALITMIGMSMHSFTNGTLRDIQLDENQKLVVGFGFLIASLYLLYLMFEKPDD